MIKIPVIDGFKKQQGIISLVGTRNFPKKQYFLPPDTHARVYLYQGYEMLVYEKLYVRTKLMIPN